MLDAIRAATRGLLVAALLFSSAARAEEGFWLYSAPPIAQMKLDHGFAPSRELLDHLMKAAARFDGGMNSGAFVSADGLFLTNWHIGKGFVRRMNASGDYLLKEGFYAARRQEEIRLPATLNGFPVRIAAVEAITDVTARVKAAASDAERAAVIAAIEKEAADATHRGQVVKLFGGTRYQLQRLKLYTDIRLVFMPEERIGAFDDNGDGISPDWPDSFNLDVCIFRIYENGRPVKPKHWLRWSVEPVEDGDLVMGSGSPGASWRNRPIARFAFERERARLTADKERRLGLALHDLADSDKEANERLAALIGRQENSRRYAGYRLDEYLDGRLLASPARNETAVRARVPGAAASYARHDAALAELTTLHVRDYLLGQDPGFGSDLLLAARRLLRGKGDEEGQKPFDLPLERARLGAWLGVLADRLGYGDPLVQTALEGKSPLRRASELVARTALVDPDRRKALLAGGTASTSDDPMLVLARAIDAAGKPIGERADRLLDEISAAEAKIEQARYTAFGNAVAPEASNTLRFTYGTVAGYRVDGRKIAAISTFGDLYRYQENQVRRDPLTLPERWVDAKARLDPGIQLNFVTTLDSVGGSSGTPIVDRRGRFVGVHNSGNFGRAASSDFFDAERGRGVGISAVGIIEALRKVYGADALADELVRGRR